MPFNRVAISKSADIRDVDGDETQEIKPGTVLHIQAVQP